MDTATFNLLFDTSRIVSDHTAIDADRIAKAKAAYTTRRVPLFDATTLITGQAIPRRGDLVLARVESIGHHTGIQLAAGRRATLFVGDEIIVCYGDRYAPDQYEALVPEDLGPCHLVAAGGVAAKACLQHGKMKPPTGIQPLGLLADSDGKCLNVVNFALPKKQRFEAHNRPLTVATVGTSMNAGKTTTAAYLIKGLVNAGFKVGAAKITGTGAPGDMNLMADAGADPVFDFTDAGFSSTYRVPIKDIEGVFETLTAHLQNAGVDVMVLEIADGLFQKETAALLSSTTFANQVDGLLLAAADAMGASAGFNWLNQRQLPVLAVSGALSLSPLAMRETADATGLKALGLNELVDSDMAFQIIEKVTKSHAQYEAVS